MIFPKKLKKGDTVAIVATSSPTSYENAMLGKKFLIDNGYKVVLCENTFESLNGYLAGSIQMKADMLNEMFRNPEIDAIFCMRGGYLGCYVVEKLDLKTISENPKIFVGYSDVTNIHLFLNQKANLVTFHGPMVSSNMIRNYDSFTKNQFEKALNMDDQLELVNPPGTPFEVLAEGEAQGRIMGGNLCILASSMGTPNQLDTRGKIIFLEEVHEIVPRIHRLLAQLQLGGHFEHAAGVILGSFTDWETPDYPNYSLQEFLKDFFKDFKIPVLANIQCGHCFPMSTIPFGTVCKMNTSNKSIIFTRN